MALGYFDTSPLMCWVKSDIADPDARDIHVAGLVDALVAEEGNTLAVSELTLLEQRSAISKEWRGTDASQQAFDGTWADQANLKLMRHVASGRFTLVKAPSRAAEHAATLVDLATAQHAIALGTWDAVHLITASAWGYAQHEVIQLYTCDDGFDRFVGHYPEFEQFVEIVNMNP